MVFAAGIAVPLFACGSAGPKNGSGGANGAAGAAGSGVAGSTAGTTGATAGAGSGGTAAAGIGGRGAAGGAGAAGTGGAGAGAAGGLGGAAIGGMAGGSTGGNGSSVGGSAGAQLDGGGTETTLAVDSVVVAPSATVRQGQTGVTITVTRAMGGLSNPTSLSLGDGIPLTVQSSSTDTTLVLQVTMIPHGTPLGSRTLSVVASGGHVMAMNVIQINPITAGPNGSDAATGTSEKPFRTLTAAMGVAGQGDTIHLQDATYNVQAGETFSYVVPANLTLEGDSTAGTIVDGAGATNKPNGLNSSTSLSLSNLTLQNFYYGIEIQTASTTVALNNVAILASAVCAMNVEFAATRTTLNIGGANTVLDSPDASGICVSAPMTSVNLTTGSTVSGRNAMYTASWGFKLKVDNATLKAGEYAGSLALYTHTLMSGSVSTSLTFTNASVTGGMYLDDLAETMTVSGSTFTFIPSTGGLLFFYGSSLAMTNTTMTTSSQTAPVLTLGGNLWTTLTGCTLTGGVYGIYQDGVNHVGGTTPRTTLRGTQITNVGNAIYLNAGTVDLGTAMQPGNNVLTAPTTGYCLYIDRIFRTPGGGPVTSSATSCNGNIPPPGSSVDGTQGGAVMVAGLYYVWDYGHLTFY